MAISHVCNKMSGQNAHFIETIIFAGTRFLCGVCNFIENLNTCFGYFSEEKSLYADTFSFHNRKRFSELFYISFIGMVFAALIKVICK